MIIEVAEEDDENNAVNKHRRVHGVGEVAVCEQVVAGVQEEQKKLHLERWEKRFTSVFTSHTRIACSHSSADAARRSPAAER